MGATKWSVSAVGWLQAGRIFNSTDSSNQKINNLNKNWLQNMGGQFTALIDISPNWEAGGGIGALQSHLPLGAISNAQNYNPNWGGYISEARISWSYPNKENPQYKINLGAFPFNYSPQTRNLGLYLTRGLVYPGIVISGFETIHVLPIANINGLQIINSGKNFEHTLIINSETEYAPYFDLSAIYLAKLTPISGFTLGAGINFFRFYAQNEDLTSLREYKGNCETKSNYGIISNENDPEVCYSLENPRTLLPNENGDTVYYDTTTGSLSGTKLMGRTELDFKKLLNFSYSGSESDFVLYSEIALLGVSNISKKYYNKRSERIPIMVGANLPTFGILDVLAFEFEYYPNPHSADLGKATLAFSWVPRREHYNAKRDDYKWSLYASKVIAKNIKASAQVANDHLRLGGTGGAYYTGSEVFIEPKNWYWMTKLAFFF